MIKKQENLNYKKIIQILSTETGKYQAYFKIDIIRLDRDLKETRNPDTWEIAFINRQPMFRHIGYTRIGVWFTEDEFLQFFSKGMTLSNPIFTLIPAGSGPSSRDFVYYPEYPIIPEKKKSFWSNLFGGNT